MFENMEVTLDYFVRRETCPEWSVPTRTIDNHELVLVLKGEGRVLIGNNCYTVRSGELIYFWPGQKHSLWVEQPPHMVFYGVHFSPPQGVVRLPLPEVSRPENRLKLEAMLRELQELHICKPYLYRWRQNILLQQLLCEILVQLHGEYSPAGIVRVKKAIELIHSEPYRTISVQELSRYAGVKKSLFLQCFKQITGSSPLQYATKLRLEYARDLLLDTRLPVAEVAVRCGFQDAFYFSRCFKKHFALPPAVYRKHHDKPCV